MAKTTKAGFKKGKMDQEFMINHLGVKLKKIKGLNAGLAQHLINTAKKYYKSEGLGKPKGNPTLTNPSSKGGLSKKSKNKKD